MKIKKKSKNFFLKIALHFNQSNKRKIMRHIPLELETTEGNAILYGHISAENPQVEGLQNNDEVLAFGTSQLYSSSWYDHENANMELYCRSCVWKKNH
jgi:predicted FMN-binding regulatory protein PaiB